MRLFLLIFCSIYGTMHFYLFWKIMHAFRKQRWAVLTAGIWCILMVAAPILIRQLEGSGPPWAARIFAYTGYIWFALIFWFCSLGVLNETWNLAIRVARLFKPSTGRLVITPRRMLVISGIIILAATTWGLIEASNVRLKEVHLKLERLPEGSRPLRIVHVTDLHLSFIVGKRHLKKVIGLIEKANADMVVSTGDMVELSFENSHRLAGLLADIQAPMGKFAAFGNHEFHHGIEETLAFHKAAGFRPLRGELVVLDNRVRVGGVDFRLSRRGINSRKTDEAAALPESLSRKHPITVLLKHEPTVDEDSLGRFDLQLSGHTHGGQIFPFQLVVRRRYPLGPGLHHLKHGSHLYVSRGAGTWAPPMRLFAPPEVTLFVIE